MSTNTALNDIKAQVENALMHQNLDPSAYAELAWDVVAAAPKLLAALEAVEALHYVAEGFALPTCNECASSYPCLTITAIEEALQ